MFIHGLDIDFIVDIKVKCKMLKSFKMRLKYGLCLILKKIFAFFPFSRCLHLFSVLNAVTAGNEIFYF